MHSEKTHFQNISISYFLLDSSNLPSLTDISTADSANQPYQISQFLSWH